jgi:hypothetical protein
MRSWEAVSSTLAEFLPGASGPIADRDVCMYTNTLKADVRTDNGNEFIIDRLPQDPRIIVGSPCSGHGAKFASAIGSMLADLATRCKGAAVFGLSAGSVFGVCKMILRGAPAREAIAVMKPRTAELVLVTPKGDPAGCLSAVPVATPWWQDVEPVVQAVRDHHGVEFIVLRLLTTEQEQPHGGRVTYLAEVSEPVRAARPWTGILDDHPRRHAFARPSGPAADLAWARARLAERGLRPTAPPAQVRTWNLSSLWRVPVEGQTIWLKVVPHFFAHEGALLALMADARVPVLLGRDGGRMLLDEIAGEDLYAAELPLLLEMVNRLVELQRRWSDCVPELLAIGLPDWRAPALGAAITDVIERTRDEIPAEDRAALAEFVRRLPGRFDDVDTCGLRDTLVHGDFHPGNFRGDAGL